MLSQVVSSFRSPFQATLAKKQSIQDQNEIFDQFQWNWSYLLLTTVTEKPSNSTVILSVAWKYSTQFPAPFSFIQASMRNFYLPF